jgi:hypothetical protein
LLALSFSQFDPTRTFGKVEHRRIFLPELPFGDNVGLP